MNQISKQLLSFLVFVVLTVNTSIAQEELNPQSLLESVKTDFNKKNYSSVIDDANKALKLDQVKTSIELKVQFFSLIGEAHLAQQNLPNALAYFVESIYLLESNSVFFNHLAESYYSLGRVNAQMGAFNQAERCFRSSFANFTIVNDPAGKLKSQLALGISLQEIGKLDRAILVFDVLIDSLDSYTTNQTIKFSVFEAYFNLLKKLNDAENGVKTGKVFISEIVKPGEIYPEIFNLIVDFNLQRKNFDEALSLCRKILLKFPNNIETQLLMAKAHLGLGNESQFENLIEQIVLKSREWEKFNVLTHAMIASLEFKLLQQDYDQALSTLLNAEKIAIENKLDKEILVLYELGQKLYSEINQPTAESRLQFLSKSTQRRIDEDSINTYNNILVADNLASKLEGQYRQAILEGYSNSDDISKNVNESKNKQLLNDSIKNKSDLANQQQDQINLQQNLQLTKQLISNQTTENEFSNQDRTEEIRALRELEKEQLLELSRKEKMILQQQYELQQAQIESTSQRQKLYLIMIGISLFAVFSLIFLILRIYNSNKIISEQNKNLKQQQEDLKLAQSELTKTLENEQHFRKGLQKTNRELKDTQSQLIHAEKMSSLGQLTAGLFHEINNPVNFVKGGIETLERSFNEIMKLLKEAASLDEDSLRDIKKVYDLKNKINEEIEFNSEIVPQIIKDMLFGTKRIEEIINSLKIFSRQTESNSEYVLLHDVINSALLILQRKIEGVATINKKFDRKIEKIECFPGQLNQVFVNLISNAIDAITEGEIVITTKDLGDSVSISFKDNGIGMNKQVIEHIFEPFFTTKEVGKGTGLGLSISYSIITNHGGSIKVYSELGKGSEFIVILKKQLENQQTIIDTYTDDFTSN